MELPSKEKLSNPLLPLIMLLTLVILLTVIISNLRPSSGSNLLGSVHPVPELPPSSVHQNFSNPETMLETFPQEEQLVHLAIKKWRMGMTDEAESDFRTILIFDPDNFTALSYLGTIFFYQGKMREAEMLYKRKADLYPGHPMGFRNLSLAQFRLGKINEAIQSLEKGLSMVPNDKEMLTLLARYHAYTGDARKTEAILIRAEDAGANITKLLNENVFQSMRSSFEKYNSAAEVLK
ncbi:MAG: tetratricopeptide repeat protein [Lentisphaeria bacterium]|nr:tetratricopeptide repeat protein [Lentisphaeria bacterium]